MEMQNQDELHTLPKKLTKSSLVILSYQVVNQIIEMPCKIMLLHVVIKCHITILLCGTSF